MRWLFAVLLPAAMLAAGDVQDPLLTAVQAGDARAVSGFVAARGGCEGGCA